MHCNKAFYQHAEAELRDQILAMPSQFDSVLFCDAFKANHKQEYEWLVQRYMKSARKWDRPHAEQIANREMTHTVRNKFADLVVKVGEDRNPHGGIMSLWRRL